jgi:hypothetical protein
MNSEDFCPQDCKYLSITEEQQKVTEKINMKTYEHRCYKYDVKLYHLLAQPNLYKCEECYKETLKNAKR